MLDSNSTSDVFRFIQIRPSLPARIEGAPSLKSDTQFARELSALPSRSRPDLATARLPELQQEVIRLLTSPTATQIAGWADQVLGSDGTIANLLAETRRHGPPALQEIQDVQARLSDFLLAAKFARGAQPARIKEAAWLFRLQAAILNDDDGAQPEQRLSDFLVQPIKLPDALSPRRPLSDTAPASKAEPEVEALRREAEAVSSAIQELASFALPGLLRGTETDAAGSDSPTPFALLPAAARRVSATVKQVLAALSIDPEATPLDEVIAQLDAQLEAYAARLVGLRPPGVIAGPTPEEEPRPYLKTVGVADLLVVKQHLKRYDRTDIAHVENILAREKKSRTHRALERIEETFTVERETIQERETELETAERFEMQRETSKTIQEDQRFGFGLTVSGKYGPSVEFSSNFGSDSSTSTQETAQSAATYAKDVMSRSLERVVERVREEQVLKILREREETNLHEFDNQDPNHVIGMYQFLEKVYESQVFNYGIRQMFDFMVPEPASYIWFLEGSPSTDLNLPTPPPRLASYAPTAEWIDSLNYLMLGALYGVEGLQPRPPFDRIATATIQQGASGATEEGRPRSVVEKEIPVPEGYRPYKAVIMPLALTDNEVTIAVNVGRVQRVWRPSGAETTSVGNGNDLANTKLELSLLSSDPFVSGSNLSVQVVAYETATFGVGISVSFVRMPEAYTQWQIKTYDAIASAYRDAVREYELRVSELKAAAESAARNAARFGNAPSQNALVAREELKKHCISIITRQRFDEPNGIEDGNPPYFEFTAAEDRGSFTRFFEQAFEWDQMQYVFYPYYWARKETWQERLLREDVDPIFLEFLKAGAARVVVPVRPGFEVAVSHYLETNVLWNGQGEPPSIDSDLYYPIVREIQERTGVPEGEIAVGDPWDTHVPTPLVILRREDSLPRWSRTDPSSWDWEELV
jgi:hypothetical protein